MYQTFKSNLSIVADQLRANYAIFPAAMDCRAVCIKFARRMLDSCLGDDDILMLARLSDCYVDFQHQIEDWSKSPAQKPN